MIEENAVVISVNNQIATLEILRNTPCGLCGQTQGCGMSTWGKFLGHAKNSFVANNPIGAVQGDVVVVGLDENAVVRSSMFVYGIPLLAMMIGVWISSYLQFYEQNKDLVSVLGAIFGLLIGFFWLGIRSSRSAYVDSRSSPVILRLAQNNILKIKCERGV